MALDYRERIPNNVSLGDNRALQRALEHWHPRFLDWWTEMGPTGFAGADVHLRTATAVDEKVGRAMAWSRCPESRIARSPRSRSCQRWLARTFRRRSPIRGRLLRESAVA